MEDGLRGLLFSGLFCLQFPNPGEPEQKSRNESKVHVPCEIAFHHEPITFHQDLRDRHRHLIEVLGWFSPDARQHIQQICRFSHVYDDKLSLIHLGQG